MTEQTPSTTRPGAPGMDRDGCDLVVIVPVLARPHRIDPFLRSLRDATPDDHDVLFVCTRGDHDTIAEVDRARMERANIDIAILPPNIRGDYAIKINHGFELTGEDSPAASFMILAADDLTFHPGWWPAARRLFNDPRVGVVGTNDLGSQRVIAGTHATHPVVRRSYIDQHGTIDEAGKVLHEGYWHEFVDDEFVATAKLRGAYAHAPDSIVEHLHPNWGKAPMDPLYAQQQRRMSYGRRVFNRRRHLWNG